MVPEVSKDDYWGADGVVGTSATWRFDGPDGLARLSGPTHVSAPDPAAFRCRLTRVQLDHVALEAFELSPCTSDRTPERLLAHPTSLLSFVLLVEGRAQVRLREDAFPLVPGQCLLDDSRDPLTWSSTTDVRVLRSVVGLEHLPEAMQRRRATSIGPLQRTPLSDSFIAFVSSVLRTAATGRRACGEQLIQAVAGLQSAVLAEAQRQVLTDPEPADLRHRMEDFIELHLGDPDLDPSAVAEAFDISLRQAHAVFNDGTRTIARFIADRRVAAVALELRSQEQPPRFSHLARRYGFRGADTLGRAFQQRFGMTLSDYRDGGHRSLG